MLSSPISRRVAAGILRQHVELAAFLWQQYTSLRDADPTDATAIARVEGRLSANLDALHIVGRQAWPFIDEQLEANSEAAELFVASVHALRLRAAERIEQLVGLSRESQLHAGMLSALAWTQPVPPSAWSSSNSGYHRYLAAHTMFAHRIDPKAQLIELLDDADARVRAIGFRIAAQQRRSDLLLPIRAGMSDPSSEVAFFAALASVELGDAGAAIGQLKQAVAAQAPHAVPAMRAVLGVLGARDGQHWLDTLMVAPTTRVLGVRGVGMLRDPAALPWLVERMSDALLAAAAGAAFLEIHGPLADPDDCFYADSEQAAEALGVDSDALRGAIPIATAFAKLLSA